MAAERASAAKKAMMTWALKRILKDGMSDWSSFLR
jgi:hypothetical protein